MTWVAPVWHPDFGDPSSELEALRGFCIELKKRRPEFVLHLDCFEEGYMKVDIGLSDLGHVAELHVVSSDDYFYGLFFGEDGEEFHFNKIGDGIDFFDGYIVAQ